MTGKDGFDGMNTQAVPFDNSPLGLRFAIAGFSRPQDVPYSPAKNIGKPWVKTQDEIEDEENNYFDYE